MKSALLKNYHFPFLKASCSRKNSKNLSVFDLSSYQRSKSALDFGLKMADPDFNIFMIAGNRSGTLEETVKYVKDKFSHEPKSICDILYLNNFMEFNKPSYFEFPSGTGKHFKQTLDETIYKIQDALLKSFAHPDFIKSIQREEKSVEDLMQKKLQDLRHFALDQGLDIHRHDDGSLIIVTAEKNPVSIDDLPLSRQKKLAPHIKKIQKKILEIGQMALAEGNRLSTRMNDEKKGLASNVIRPYITLLEKEFSGIQRLDRWFKELSQDMVHYLHLFLKVSEDEKTREDHLFIKRYGAHVFLCNEDLKYRPVIVECNPTYENLFGSIKYHPTHMGGYETDCTMIFPGSLHRANGGILILRAEELANNPQAWHALKSALRDKKIRIEEPYRVSTIPLLDAPTPEPIPLNLQIILVGDMKWYYSFFYQDEDFQTHFKIKADVDTTIPAQKKNLDTLFGLLANFCQNLNFPPETEAIETVMSYGCRLASHRKKITGDLLVFQDLLKEAKVFCQIDNRKKITMQDVNKAILARHHRNSKFQDLEQEYLAEDLIMIQTRDGVVGQINGLTVQTIGSETFGTPSRITARTYMGRHGVLNIEHAVDLGGPIQHKGVLSLEGFLKGLLARKFPISFSCNITFEQNYSGVEGDSSSVAELLAILSSLSGLPLRQDIAVTGSMNQFGIVQPVGSVNEKIEGFFYACKRQGLTGTQGVMIPKGNEINLTLMSEVADNIDAGKFHIWSFDDVFDAIELLTGLESGYQDFLRETQHSKETVFGRVYQQLKFYDNELKNHIGLNPGDSI